MRFMALLVGAAVLSGCSGTRVLEVDPTNEADRNALVEAAQAHSGEIVSDGNVITFRQNQLQVTQDTLRVLPRLRASGTSYTVPLRDDYVDVRFRYKGSPLGAAVGVAVGSTAGYAVGYSRGEGSGFCCTRKENAVIGAALVGIVGAIVGAVVGPKKTTIYRVQPDTPQQMSVVIGVGSASIAP